VDPATLARLLAAALPDEGLTAADLGTCCYGPDTEVVGEPDAAAAFTVKRFGDVTVAWLLLLAVHPDRQRRGVGRAALDTVVRRAREHGAFELHLGNCPPRYVWPGVDFRFTPALALFEAAGFDPYGAECNMTIGTSFRADPPIGVVVDCADADGSVELARRHYPHWADETGRAVEGGTCFEARAGTDTVGFACHSVNRAGWIGPMATHPDQQRGGVGRALLAAVCVDLAARGREEADVAWVGPVGFYAKCGARVSRVFRTARLRLTE
jgi:GNAT superfamily N-acetyltransferase